ncbi:NAD(P)H-hydrate dehydratase [Corynebacterium sp. MSK151]|uniref:NAD(P)H-hydrate dehydratase n=1 Tax=unclassified Corynebacterium TaxID=2624378 RepID=UPI00254F0EB3|nr:MULTISPECIES: NAD(P)H-hydrate dehydratase [unclassified Corynebacterium]MDK8758940.1 NAD(P)H-hydrate dehydratase [Corynebacterium sp. MSK151]MDK8848077.1 NAD(P)H-hydrate dehydratase [Corynebacterium sp. MSK047]
MTYCYTAAEIRAAEQPYLDAQTRDDELMRHAAAAVSEVAERMLSEASPEPGRGRVLLLVGSGGNGGDALYAGRNLSSDGHGVDAVLLGSKPHERALKAFELAGGRVLPLGCDRETDLSKILWSISEDYALIIDGIVGLGGHGALREEAAWLVREARLGKVPILAVDVPSGVEADTGRTFDPPAQTINPDPDLEERQNPYLPSHVEATTTVTFGGLRYAHSLSESCGTVELHEISLDSFSLELPGLGQTLYENGTYNTVHHQTPTVEFYEALGRSFPAPLGAMTPLEPGAADHKYSTGVTGIAAGSEAYPGAGQLCATAAVHATSPAVIYVGDAAARNRITAALPTVIAQQDSVDRKEVRVDAWVVGPGRGTDEKAAEELRDILTTDKPVVIDADALTLLSKHEDIRQLVRERGQERNLRTVLTPHAGEFERLTGHEVTNPIADARELAEQFSSEVLLKGRRTVMVNPTTQRTVVIDAGSSWAATPGSGDVLSGLLGAWVARGEALYLPAIIHARAAFLAAQTEFGPAPCSAQDIAESIRDATAWFTNEGSSGKIRL